MSTEQRRTYDRARSVVFLKTDAPFGGLSNMAGGFPLLVNGMRILTSEALYQACRFPHRPEVQRLIIGQTSPMTAKMKSEPYRHDSRPDWDHVRVKIMRWCLRVKLAQNWRTFSALLLETGERPIVEESRRDDFWGASPTAEGTLVGMNVLGRLLMELREAVKTEDRDSLTQVQPPAISDFLLCERPIGIVGALDHEPGVAVTNRTARGAPVSLEGAVPAQPTLFDRLEIREPPPPPYLDVEPVGVQVADLKPYPEYKESGSKWLGAVPLTWEVRNLRTLISKRAERNRPDLPLLSVAREKGVFVRSLTDAEENHNVIPDDLSNYKVAHAGNLVINKMKAWQGSMGIAPCDGIVSPAYFVFDFRIDNHAFGQRLLRSKPYVAHFGQASDGVRVGQWDLSVPGMRQIPVLVPPPPEQAAIVRFLDWANSHLDRAIRAKRKVIALLNEQKQAIIHRAVTRGLDPSVPLKPSGIPWLGDIPQHWEAWRISRFARVGNGSTPSRGKPAYWDNGTYPWLNSSQVNRELIDSADQFITSTALKECHLPRVPAGSVLIAITGQGKTRGTAAILQVEATINQHIAFITPRTNIVSAEYLHAALVAEYRTLRELSEDSGSTKGALTCEDLKRFKVVLPPIWEQVPIVERIRTETRVVTTAISRLEREIDLLCEYRIRLVADVVTGKLDVREAASRLPDEAPPEAIQDDPDLSDDPEAADEEAAA